MKITVDTNVLVRVVTRDDEDQAKAAAKSLREAEVIAITVPSLCELVWVLRKGYGLPRGDIAAALRALLNSQNVVVDRPAAEAGLAVLDAGGDFADGAIAFEGRWLGGETFMSFDKKAVELLRRQGLPAGILS